MTEERRDAGEPGYRESHLDLGDSYDDRLADLPFDVYMTNQEARILRHVIPSLFRGRVPSYLDFACGTGRITEIVRPLVGNAFGIDVSESMVRRARERVPDAEFYVIDITRTSSPVPKVELVTSFRFFGNAEDSLRIEALAAIATQLHPGGYLVLNAHRNPMSIINLLRRARRLDVPVTLSHRAMRKMLRDHGFVVTRVFGIGGWIIRGRLATREVLESSCALVFERLARYLIPSWLCPDAVFVAQKRR